VPQNFERTPMLLGAEFLRSHRALVAHSQRTLYFTYLGSATRQGLGVTGSGGDSGRPIAE
jgi:hypothetical protein